MPKIIKSTIQFNVFHRDDVDLSHLTLKQILEDCDFGELISGSVDIAVAKTITDPDELHKELLAIGNDGTFFDDGNERSFTDEELREECEELGIRIVQSEDEETLGRWDWLSDEEASDTSFDTEREAMLNALMCDG